MTALSSMIAGCWEAYEKTKDKRLRAAASALEALENINLAGCEENSPLPWTIAESERILGEKADAPIRSCKLKDNAVLRRDSGWYPPDMKTCEAIVTCMNTVHSLQKKQTCETQEETDASSPKEMGQEGFTRSDIAKMVISEVERFTCGSHDGRHQVTPETCIAADLYFDRLDEVRLIIAIEEALNETSTELICFKPEECENIKTVGDIIALSEKYMGKDV